MTTLITNKVWVAKNGIIQGNLPGIWIDIWTIQMENLSIQRFTDSEKGKIDTPETSDNK